MLKECRSHGFFRGEICPNCGDESKFLLNDRELELLGRTMAGILRHFPERYGLDMDEHGWVDLRDFVTAVQIRHKKFRFLKPHHVLGIIDTDPKGRYQFLEGKIRATYAHSCDVSPDLPTDDIPEILFFPTTEEECSILLEIGLKPSDRKMVHLSGTLPSAMEAGQVRVNDPVILEVDTKKAEDEGVEIGKAGTTVYTTKDVPPGCLRRLAPEEIEEGMEMGVSE
ncbi:MAG: RNA 2'-phosphotransferase [Candidatus Thermoplasmatota archaeon]|nr:RNA 2'-phosphotransferase [Candidatus Thermoplasmatota archaeon]